ncbi:glycosyltransferase [Cyanobium sp. CH-040]|uniref:glycosyltransferase n=1 Tax=Cyanobium sp. CH-040 TaxID=2823708 RepID=UPI0020CF8EAF|nr:glycosyltransferase [Cyanobium sp. CH-040]MCP9928003.1 glycosyltransferase family 2 protein [Cyanobium sp. CH-040]
MLNLHVRLNLGQLIRRLHALPGVPHYLFCGDCGRASLWRCAELPAGEVISLSSQPVQEGPVLLLALPLAWSRGLLDGAAAPALRDVAAAGARFVTLQDLPAAPEAVPSALGRLWNAYSQLGESPPVPGEAVRLLQFERLLKQRFAPGSVVPARRLEPWPLDDWLAGIEADPRGLTADLVALLHLLPAAEQPSWAGSLAVRIEAALRSAAEDPQPWLRLLEGLVGGINSRDPRLQASADRLRELGLRRAGGLADPAQGGLVLARLLQASPLSAPLQLGPLAAAIDALVLAIDQASAAGDRDRRRQLQRDLEGILRGVGPNLLLLRALVPALAPDTCYRLPFVQPPSVCLLLLKGALLLDAPQVVALEGARRKALVALVERTLPRIWWQEPLLVRLLHDLRRFHLDPGWQREGGTLLAGLELLHSRGIPPLPQEGPRPESAVPEDGTDPARLLRTQVLLLLRLMAAPDERAGLLRLAAAAGNPPVLRLLDGEDEEAPVMAAAAGLAARSLMLARLAAERRGVPELLPPVLPPGGVETAFGAILDHWRSCFGAEAGREQASIAVVITTHAPRLGLLRLALRSLALQTLRPSEVWLVDDGSPAAAAAALVELVGQCRNDLDLPLHLVRRDENQGQYLARNLALELMGAEVLAIQDDDDLSHPLRLELQWQALQQGRAAVYAGHVRLDEASAALQPDGDGGAFFGDGIATLMTWRATARGLGGFYPVRSRGDVEFRGRLERRYGTAAVPRLDQPLYLMRGAATTISSRFEYGCSLSLPSWRGLMGREVLV